MVFPKQVYEGLVVSQDRKVVAHNVLVKLFPLWQAVSSFSQQVQRT